jgi:multimeric flavodoxin WrbA
MKIVAICGNFREESNTNKLVKKVAESSGCEYELVYLGTLDIKPCTGCGSCMMLTDGQCVIKDDMQGMYEKIMSTDALILGSPTYFLDVSGGVKSFIDRTMAICYRGIGPAFHPDMPWLGNRPLAGKPAVAVVTVAGGGHERAIETLKLSLDFCHHMNLVAQLAEVVGMNDVKDMPEVMKRSEEAGRKLGAALKG